ncbi:hypothetical protein [Nonomuraea dietziae]|uniref:hypothetical protein n=1 Tax=Nonomuraea dietziae TaxID=65515 RepID=UPI0031CEBEC5
MSSVTGLLGDEELERSSVVANCLMTASGRLPGYNRELGLDIAAHLRARTAEGARVRWLDLCCGTAGALFEAAHTLPPQVEMVGVDLVDFFVGPAGPAQVAADHGLGRLLGA